MFKSLFQALFGSFSRKQRAKEQRMAESLLIQRLIDQAQAIAEGDYVTNSSLPNPVIPERRKQSRKETK